MCDFDMYNYSRCVVGKVSLGSMFIGTIYMNTVNYRIVNNGNKDYFTYVTA